MSEQLVSVCMLFTWAARHRVLKYTCFFVLFCFLSFFPFADFALWTLIGSRPYDSFFVVSHTVLESVMADWLSAQFVFIRIRNAKRWNHLRMCTVVLWTKIVVEFNVSIERIAAIKKRQETGKPICNVSRETLLKCFQLF